MKHTITLREFRDWVDTEVWHLAASSHGRGTQKKIEMSNTGAFRVMDHGKVAYIGSSDLEAVEAYNAAD